MSRRQKLKSGAEYDAVTGWRRFHKFRAGVRRAVKRALNKRGRKEAKKRRTVQLNRGNRCKMDDKKGWTVTRNGVDLRHNRTEEDALAVARFYNNKFPRDRYDARPASENGSIEPKNHTQVTT